VLLKVKGNYSFVTAGDKLYSKAEVTCDIVVQPVMTEILTTVLLRVMWVLQESVENVKYRRKNGSIWFVWIRCLFYAD